MFTNILLVIQDTSFINLTLSLLGYISENRLVGDNLLVLQFVSMNQDVVDVKHLMYSLLLKVVVMVIILN